MKTKSKRPSAPAQRSRGQQRARARLLHPRAGRRCTPRSRAPPMPRRRRRPFYSMGFARSAGALDIICAAGEASGSGVWRRLTRGRAQACVAWRRRAGAGREYRGAPGSARCLRSGPKARTASVTFHVQGSTSGWDATRDARRPAGPEGPFDSPPPPAARRAAVRRVGTARTHSRRYAARRRAGFDVPARKPPSWAGSDCRAHSGVQPAKRSPV